jgi:hypothetical protein
MAAITPTTGDQAFLQSITNKQSSGNLVLRLFTSNTTPSKGDTLSTYTECTGSGYSPITLLGGSWTVSANEDGTATASYAAQTFTFTSGTAFSAYGYFLTNSAGTTVIWAERFSDGPYAIPAGGGTISVTPNYSAS